MLDHLGVAAILAISLPRVLMFSLRVMFLRRASSSTACSLRLISRERSSVMLESLSLDEYREAMMPPLAESLR